MPQNIVSLLTPYGRVLILLIERPGLTVREMSVFLGVTETNITKAITKLQSEDLIARTKVNGRFEYSIVFENAENHSDIRRLISFISKIITQSE
jgi:predicted transcriptional regulator